MSDKAASVISAAAVIITILICLTYISLNHTFVRTTEITQGSGGKDYFYIHKVNRFNASSETHLCSPDNGCKEIFSVGSGG